MAAPAAAAPAFQKETTYTSFSQEQSKLYARDRRNYHPSVYEAVYEYHRSTGGNFGSLLDVGCGPGLATFTLAPQFEHVTGIDPSESMISTARAASEDMSKHMRFECSTAESLGSELTPSIPENSMDIITVANAAHWCNMAEFWPSAARVLKPGGTVAVWCSGPIVTDPSTPNAAKIQAACEKHFEEYLKQYEQPGHLLIADRYRTLLLPWTMEHPVTAFDQSSFVRKEWVAGEDPFLNRQSEMSVETFERLLDTTSAVTEWRNHHPELVGTEQDVMRVWRTQIEQLLDEAGAEKNKVSLVGNIPGVVLLLKKRI